MENFCQQIPEYEPCKASSQSTQVKAGFIKAVASAQSIISDPKKQAAYKVQKGQSVFNPAMAHMKRKRLSSTA